MGRGPWGRRTEAAVAWRLTGTDWKGSSPRPGPTSEGQRPSLLAMAATGGPGGQPEALTRREVLLSVVCGAVPILPAHRGGHLPRGICRAPVRTRGPLVQDPCVSPGARPQLLPWVGPSAAPRHLGGTAHPTPPAGYALLAGWRPPVRPAELCPEFSTQWHLGGAGGLLPPLPSVDGGFLSSELVGEAEDGGSLAPARRPARLRPFAKLNYHGHGLGDKKLKTKDFKITSFQVGENGPWLGPRSHVPNSEVWVSRNADK